MYKQRSKAKRAYRGFKIVQHVGTLVRLLHFCSCVVLLSSRLVHFCELRASKLRLKRTHVHHSKEVGRPREQRNLWLDFHTLRAPSGVRRSLPKAAMRIEPPNFLTADWSRPSRALDRVAVPSSDRVRVVFPKRLCTTSVIPFQTHAHTATRTNTPSTLVPQHAKAEKHRTRLPKTDQRNSIARARTRSPVRTNASLATCGSCK